MKTLHYFAASTVPPLFEVFEVYDDNTHSQHQNLLNDIHNISPSHLEWFDSNFNIDFLLEKNNREIAKLLYVLIEMLNLEIGKLRVMHLKHLDSSAPAPYNHISLQGLELDKNFLVHVSDLQVKRGGFSLGGEVFMLLPSTNATNSTYWLLQELGNIRQKELIKIRLDPLIHQPADAFNPMVFRMQVYGKSFEWTRIKSLQTIEHTQFIPTTRTQNIFRTDLIWDPSVDEIHFTCEELPNKDLINVRGSRYFHAIFDKISGSLKHCDGAIRFYDDEEYDSRTADHLKNKAFTRIGKRVKVFQIDVPNEILNINPVTHKNFIDLVTSFFVWNDDVFRYFNT